MNLKLPNWTDPHAVASYIISAFAMVVTVLTAFHIGLPTNAPPLVQGLAPIAGLLVAAAAQIVNMVTHRSAHTAAITANLGFAAAVGAKPPAVVTPPAQSEVSA